MTHATLEAEHAEMCIKALSASVDPVPFDRMIIYNTHQHELSNEYILSLCNDLPFIDTIDLFEYDPSTPKTLAGDINAIREYCVKTFAETDHILLLKSDMLLSQSYLNELSKFDDIKTFLFIAPLFNAKRSVPDDELFEFTRTNSIALSSEESFFMEDENHSNENHFRDRCGATPADPKIKYLSCTGKADWSCPYFSMDIFPQIVTIQKDWGGWNAERVRQHWFGAYKSFTVHKFHGIESVNRIGDRPGDYGKWLNNVAKEDV